MATPIMTTPLERSEEKETRRLPGLLFGVRVVPATCRTMQLSTPLMTAAKPLFRLPVEKCPCYGVGVPDLEEGSLFRLSL
jgi:hypothetical protein